MSDTHWRIARLRGFIAYLESLNGPTDETAALIERKRRELGLLLLDANGPIGRTKS